MPKFSELSIGRLQSCDVRLQILFRKVIENYDCKVLQGHRSKAQQDEYFSVGRSKLRWPNSKHNKYPSLAVDVSPFPVPDNWGNKSRSEYEKFKYFAFYVLGVADTLNIPIRWGGDWDGDFDTTDQTFNDLVHFEIDE